MTSERAPIDSWSGKGPLTALTILPRQRLRLREFHHCVLTKTGAVLPVREKKPPDPPETLERGFGRLVFFAPLCRSHSMEMI